MNKDVKERCGVNVDVIEKVKRNTLIWFGHVKRMESESLTKRVYVSGVDGDRGRGKAEMEG